jgi:DNA mismatch repair protein MutS
MPVLAGYHGGIDNKRIISMHGGRATPALAGSGQHGTTRDAGATPMMAQYLEIKAAHANYLLFYRMGDFFELFFDDARQAACALGIQLTRRGKHLGEDIPMCGVPVARGEEYLQKLIAKGFRVAVCEQTEDPAAARKRGAKSIVRRDVVRIVTPGTLTEDALLDAGANNFLVAVHRLRASDSPPAGYALAALDMSTGEFLLSELAPTELAGELVRLSARELLVAEHDEENGAEWAAGPGSAGAAITPIPRAYFDSRAGEDAIKSALGALALDGFGSFTRGELAAAGALLKYVELTQVGARPLLRAPLKARTGDAMAIDAATRASLELVRTQGGETTGSLLHAVDRTLTAPGRRELSARLSRPLTDVAAIAARQDALGWLVDDPAECESLRETLRHAPDVARALSRLSLARGGPRDLGTVRDMLATARDLHDRLAAARQIPDELARIMTALAGADMALLDRLNAALADALPHSARDGGFVRAGFSAELDETLRLRDNSRSVIAGLQARYAQTTGLKTLKIRHNNVLGYFIEVSAANGPALADNAEGLFRHRQTLANAVRFTTAELAETESRITLAAERALGIEHDIFAALCSACMAHHSALMAIASAVASLDVFCGFAELAREGNYIRPVVDSSGAFSITAGRHPVVERAMAGSGMGFIANDCALDADPGPEGEARLMILTGPNMAGKSTFLRQNALIAVLAQAGSFVPAQSAHIGVIDRLFSRVGASDDLARGRSTFMVEMIETAAILNQAGPRALVILDEIGRGTSTFDGLSIAWAAAEHLHDVNRCRSMFATHYHELTALAERLDHAACATIRVKEWGDDIVFLHEVVPGAADRSYGIQVARLAGVPKAVVERARAVLKKLEPGEPGAKGSAATALVEELPLFAAAGFAETAQTPPETLDAREADALRALRSELALIEPDHISPRDALALLYRLKALAGGAAGP